MWTVAKVSYLHCSKQDVFVGFATVPGFVSLTSTEGSPYLQVSALPVSLVLCHLHTTLPMQALASQLADHHDTTDLADIHLLVKRKLAAMKIGEGGVCQVGAWPQSQHTEL